MQSKFYSKQMLQNVGIIWNTYVIEDTEGTLVTLVKFKEKNGKQLL